MSSLYFKFLTILIKHLPVALPKIVNLKNSNGLNMIFDNSSVACLNFKTKLSSYGMLVKKKFDFFSSCILDSILKSQNFEAIFT